MELIQAEKYLNKFLHFIAEPILKSTLQKCQKLQLIVDLFESEEGIRQEWFENVIKTFDKNFIIKSFEYALGKWPHYCDIWKMYILYLENINAKKLLLTVYSKYCRLYINDDKMWKKYIKKIKEINGTRQNVTKWWIDIVEGERTYESHSSAKKYLTFAIKHNKFPNDEEFVSYVQWFKNCKNKKREPFVFYLPGAAEELEDGTPQPAESENLFYVKPQNRSPMYFSENTMHRQLFSLPYNYISYLRLTSTPENLQKLYHTCKYFFHKSKTPLCHRLSVLENCEPTYFSQSLFLNLETINFNGLKDLTVTNLFQVYVKQARNVASLLLTTIKCSNISHLELYRQTLSEKEFNLVSGDKIKTVTLTMVAITDYADNNIPMAKIVEKFPKAFSIRLYYYSHEFEEGFAESLANLKREKNLIRFVISHAPLTLNEDFFIFIKKFSLPHAIIRVHFFLGTHQDQIDAFQSLGNEMLKRSRISFEIY